MNRPTLAPEVHASLAARWQPLVRSQLHYHVSWSTRGRRPLFKDRHLSAIESLVQSICDERGYDLDQVAVGADHVHVLVALRATQSIASVVRELKGRLATTLLVQHPELRVWLRGNLVWDESYAVQTVSAARLERARTRMRALHGAEESLARAS